MTAALTGYRPDPRFHLLGDNFFDSVVAARFPALRCRFRNERWASRVGLNTLGPGDWETHFGDFKPLPNNLEQPLAMRYHGHQFDHYNPDLGDGRGFLFAQLRDDQNRLLDLGTKGSGQTPWSRSGDGRLTLKGGVREILATEMLEALGVNTSKSFSLFETGEALERHDEPSPTRASVLVRLSHSHIRVGTFQRHAYEKNETALGALLEHCIALYYPELAHHASPALAFLEAFSERAAHLCGQWLGAGFVHGVLNSDNQNITGESFDYGPWRFLPMMDGGFTAAYFDHNGLYAYGRQPNAVAHNVHRLGECLQLIDPTLEMKSLFDTFAQTVNQTHVNHVLWRLGLEKTQPEKDAALAQSMIEFLAKGSVNYATFFHDLFGGGDAPERARQGPRAPAYSDASFDSLADLICERAPRECLGRQSHILQDDSPCDLLVEEVESIWDAIATEDDWQPFEKKIADIRALGQALA